MSHNARSSHVFNTRYSLTIKMHHKKYHWMGIVQAIIPRLQIELTIGELVPFQNHAGLRGWTRTGRPYPASHEIRKSSTCGFDFTDYGMPEGSRPGPVNRHGFEIAGWAGGAIGPDNGPGAGRMAVGRMAARAAEAKKRRPAGLEMSQGRRRGGGGHAAARGARPRGPDRASRAPRSRARPASPAPPPKVFPKLSLHRRGSSRIVLLRTGA